MKKSIKLLALSSAVLMVMTLTGCNREGDDSGGGLFHKEESSSTSTGLPIDATHSDIGEVSAPTSSTTSTTTEPISSSSSTTTTSTSEPIPSSSSSTTSSTTPSGGGVGGSTLTKIPIVPVEELPLVPPLGTAFDDKAPLNIVMINGMPIDLLTVNPKEFCQLADNFYMQISANYLNTKYYENKAGFLFEGVPVAQGFNGSANVYIETLDANGELLTEWRLDTDPDNPLPYDDYEIKGIHYDQPFGRTLDISFVGGLLDMGIVREDAEELVGYGFEQHIEKKTTNAYTGEEITEYTNLVYYKNTDMSMVLEYKEYDGRERLMGITLVKNHDKRDQ